MGQKEGVEDWLVEASERDASSDVADEASPLQIRRYLVPKVPDVCLQMKALVGHLGPRPFWRCSSKCGGTAGGGYVGRGRG